MTHSDESRTIHSNTTGPSYPDIGKPLRVDDLRVSLGGDSGEVLPVQQNEFRKHGHILIRNLLSREELSYYRRLVIETIKNSRTGKRIMDLCRAEERIRQFVVSGRLAKAAAGLLGVAHVDCWHDQASFKGPGEGAEPWRRGQADLQEALGEDRQGGLWEGPQGDACEDPAGTIILWIPLTDMTVEMGMPAFATGSHLDSPVWENASANGSDREMRRYIKEHHYPITRAAGIRAGDTIWYYGNTICQASANESDFIREATTVVYKST